MAAIVTISGRCGQTAVALSGLGIFIGVISRNAQLTVLYSQAIFLPSMIISGGDAAFQYAAAIRRWRCWLLYLMRPGLLIV